MKFKNGFTLIELLVTLAIILISISAASPSLFHIVQQNRITSELNTLITLANYTRKLAVSHGKTSILCPSSDTKNCDNRDWTSPLIIFIDANNNKKRDSNEPLQRSTRMDTSNLITWKASSNSRYLRFNQYGHGITFGSFYHCSSTQQNAVRRLAISRTGRTLLHPDYDRDGTSDSVTEVTNACE